MAKAMDSDQYEQMHHLEMYLDAVFDANPEVKRPVGDRRGWGVAVCLVCAGKAPSFMEWCALAQVPIKGPKPEPEVSSEDELSKLDLPPDTVLVKKNGDQVQLTQPEVSDAEAESVVREALQDADYKL